MGILRLILAFLRVLLGSRASLAAENLALRQQLLVLHRSVKRPNLRRLDRIFWSWLSRVWSGWQDALVIVQPATVIAWRRRKFCEYWTRLSRSGKFGRPTVPREVRDLIRRTSSTNPLWGEPAIVGELRKIGIDVTTNPTAEWTAQQIVEAFPWDDAPRYLLRDRDGIYGAYFRRRVKNMGIEQVVIAARSPWQSPYVERLIGSIRRDCLDHSH